MAQLLVSTSGRKVRKIELGEEAVTVGRSAENEVMIDGPEASRFHCIIQKSESGYELVDLGSKNGTFVNGRMVTRKFLRDGDEVRIGKTVLRFEDAKSRTRHATGDYSTVFIRGESAAGVEAGREVTREERLLKLLELNKALNSERNLRRLLHKIMDTVLEVVKAERGFLIMFEPEGSQDEMEVKVSRNLDRESVPKPLLKFSRSIASQVRESGNVIVAVDAQDDDRFKAALSVHGLKLRSVLCVPLKARSRMLGVVYVDNRFERGAFTADEVKLLEILSDQAAVAIENARLFEENLLKQKELERSKGEVEKLNLELTRRMESQHAELERARTLIEKRRPKFKYSYDPIITHNKAMYRVFGQLDKIIESDIAVLIQGESGTGKELIAQAIHRNGPRKDREFIAQNCSAIPYNLVESEFFGHTRGAFTGAHREKPGLFELADGGSMFLDEIADLPLAVQAKLLRVLEEGELRRVGGKDTIHVDVRIISATNRNLAEAVREGKFREDLFYRLNVITLELPPLRERKEDLTLLVDYFLDRMAQGRPGKRISAAALDLLVRYDWPGNIRELENELQRAAVLSGETITPAHLSENLFATIPKSAIEGVPGEGGVDGKTLREVMDIAAEAAERAAIVNALKKCGWQKKEAARLLDISRPTLYAKLKRYGIKTPK